MKKWKICFSIFTIILAFMALMDNAPISRDIIMPLMFISLSMNMFTTAKEYREKQQKGTSVYFMVVGIFLLIVTLYNVASLIFGI